ncbi:hypothetical protein [Mycobacterium uberis]|nr:hypothetical protein [Mycobacterium uberis]
MTGPHRYLVLDIFSKSRLTIDTPTEQETSNGANRLTHDPEE